MSIIEGLCENIEEQMEKGMIILCYFFIILAFCFIPAGVMWLCRKVAVLGKLGPIMILYAIGMGIANMPFIPEEPMSVVQDILPNVLIPLAIPMMLYGCKFTSKAAGLQLKVVLSGILSVTVAVVIGYLVFGKSLPQGAQIGGIITGMYTGGTVNAAALQAVFGVESETFILINSYDILISFLYFVFLFAIGIRMFRWLYGEKTVKEIISVGTLTGSENQLVDYKECRENSYQKLRTKEGLKQLWKILVVTIGVVAVSAGTAIIFPDNYFMIIFILLITTLGVACSFVPAVKKFDMSYDVGMYLIYIFSITIASMADFSKLSLESGIGLLCFMVIAVFISLALHAVFCRITKVDADSMVISSVAFINSPPFVPMVSAAMKNRDALVTGLAAGIVGYAIGNHLGVLIAQLL